MSLQNLVDKIEGSVLKNLSKGVLFSGGLDTSIIAYILSKNGYNPTLVTVGLKGYNKPDIHFSKTMAQYLGTEHIQYVFDTEELFARLKETVEILKTFDPMEIRNSVAILIGLYKAKQMGIEDIYTGDGADEIFGGYGFLFNLERARQREEINRMISKMSFSSPKLGKYVGIKIHQPFIEKDIINFAKTLPTDQLINKADNGKQIGKWILREAYQESLPSEIIWREKTPIETGSGTGHLPQLIAQKIKKEEYLDYQRKIAKKDGVKLRDREHLYYYLLYKEKFGVPGNKEPATGTKLCPNCGVALPEEVSFCRTCGAYFGDIKLN